VAAQRTDLVVVFLQQISRPFTGKHHQIFCFTSIKLSCNSLRDKTYMCRTIYFNRRGFPNSLSPPHKADVKALRKSMSKFHPPGNLVASVWKDTKLVCFISIHSNSVGNHTINRNYCTSSHCSCHHFLQQKHGWS